MRSALSEILDVALPYSDVLSLRDRMWEICPTLIKHDITERTSPELILAGLSATQTLQASAKVTGKPFEKPVKNFYQTDPISRAYVYFCFVYLV